MSFSFKKMIMDLIFWVQVSAGIVFWVSQSIRMLSSTQGISTSSYLFSWVFVVINLSLALKARKEKPGRILTQMMTILAIGFGTYLTFLGLIFFKSSEIWDQRDNVTAFLVFIGVTGTFIGAGKFNLPKSDPFVKGIVSFFFKSVPQFIMAYKILAVGGNGLSGVMILMFHVLTLSRILQTYLIINEAGWDRNRKGIMISESGNELSWICVTIAWVIMVL